MRKSRPVIHQIFGESEPFLPPRYFTITSRDSRKTRR